jgi:hypothetical protein
VERRLAVHAGAHRKALIAVLVLVAAPANAAPKDGEARKLFERGVAAYGKGDYSGASKALSDSYQREGDPETLFAWAQSERKQGNCNSAIELYNTLLAFSLPAENKKVIEGQLAECKQIVASQAKPAEPPPPPPEPAHVAPEPPHPTPPAPAPEDRAWWRDPVGDVLVGGGVVGLGVGAALLVSAHSADQAKNTAASYAEYKDAADRAHDRGLYGVIGAAAGGALVIGGVVWYATHRGHRSVVTGWLAPAGGGIAVGRGF